MQNFNMDDDISVALDFIQGFRLCSTDFQSGRCTLTLSVSALSFVEHILENRDDYIELVDLNLLEDNISALKHLTLHPGHDEPPATEIINLSFFPNLVSLALKKIDAVNLDIDPDTLHQLEEIKCMYSFQAVENLFRNVTSSLDHLSKLSLPYCNITSSDDILNQMPFLKYVDLKFNRLKTVDFTQNLNLKFVDVSFNVLEILPCFNMNETSELKTLLLHNNFITDIGLRSLNTLERLEILNLSGNLLANHNSLSLLSDLYLLKELWLFDNPFSNIKNHRMCFVKYLHENISVNPFLLDGRCLTREENLQVGIYIPPLYSSPSDSESMGALFEIIPSKSQTVCSGQKKNSTKSRNVEIVENTTEEAPRKKISKTESPKEYLSTKTRVENIKDNFGDNWLNNEAGSVMQNLMGLQNSPKEIEYSENNNSFETISTVHATASSLKSSTPLDASLIISGTTVFTNDDSKTNNQSACSELVVNVDSEKQQEHCPYPDDVVDEECGGSMFAATRDKDKLDVFLKMEEGCFKEKDTLRLKTLMTFPYKNITDCNKLDHDNYVKVSLTIKSHRPSIYLMESTDANSFCEIINEILENRVRAQLFTTKSFEYQCIKCAKMFSVVKSTINDKGERIVCEACGSPAVVEVELSSKNVESNRFIKSPSESSIGSANSLKTFQDIPILRKYDSDVEVLSNFSVSSVEILEVMTEKRPSEEKQLLDVVPELFAVSEHNISSSGLTESSSSGSLTDSVCTTYDGSRRRTVTHVDSSVLLEEDENKDDQVTLLITCDNNLIIPTNSSSESHENLLTPANNNNSEYHDDDSLIEFNYVTFDFQRMHPRLQRYLTTFLFKEKEEFLFAQKCQILDPNQYKHTKLDLNYIIFTNTTFYLFKINQDTPQTRDFSSWFIHIGNYSTRQIETFAMLPHQVGHYLTLNVEERKQEYFILDWDPLGKETGIKKFFNQTFYNHYKEFQEIDQFKDIKPNLVKTLTVNEENLNTFVIPMVAVITFRTGDLLTKVHHFSGVVVTNNVIMIVDDCLDYFFGYKNESTRSCVGISKPLSSLLQIEYIDKKIYKNEDINQNEEGFIEVNLKVKTEEFLSNEFNNAEISSDEFDLWQFIFHSERDTDKFVETIRDLYFSSFGKKLDLKYFNF